MIRLFYIADFNIIAERRLKDTLLQQETLLCRQGVFICIYVLLFLNSLLINRSSILQTNHSLTALLPVYYFLNLTNKLLSRNWLTHKIKFTLTPPF